MDKFILYRKNPFEKFIVFFLTFACTVDLICGAKPGSVQYLLPGWYWYLWLGVTLAGSLVYLYGIYTHNLKRGLYLVWSAAPVIAVAVGAIGVAQLYYAGITAALSGGLVLGISTAFAVRRKQLGEIIQALPKKIGPPK